MAGKKKDKAKGSGYINHGMVAQNKKARFEYEILETVEAGLVLKGSEVKSLRLGRANISDAYASENQGEVYLQGALFAEWQPGHPFNHYERRPRKLLLKKREINKLLGQVKQKGMTLVPLKLYFDDHGRAKVLIGLAKGRQTHEKRDVIKKRDWEREKSRIMKTRE